MKSEQLTPEMIQAEVSQLNTVDAIRTYIRNAKAELRAAEPDVPAITAETARISKGLDGIDADLTAAGNEVIEMWRDEPPKE